MRSGSREGCCWVSATREAPAPRRTASAKLDAGLTGAEGVCLEGSAEEGAGTAAFFGAEGRPVGRKATTGLDFAGPKVTAGLEGARVGLGSAWAISMSLAPLTSTMTSAGL